MKKAGFMVGTALAAFMGAAQAEGDITLEQYSAYSPVERNHFISETTASYAQKLGESNTTIDKALCIMRSLDDEKDYKSYKRVSHTLNKYAQTNPTYPARVIVEKSWDKLCKQSDTVAALTR